MIIFGYTLVQVGEMFLVGAIAGVIVSILYWKITGNYLDARLEQYLKANIPEEWARIVKWYRSIRKEPKHIKLGNLVEALKEPEWMYDKPKDGD